MKDSKLHPELNRISKYGNTQFKTVSHSAVILNDDTDLQYPVDYLTTVEVLSDYNGDITDYILVTMMLPLGDFVKTIYPLKENLNMRLSKIGLDKTYRNTFKAAIVSDVSAIESGMYRNKSKEALNNESMVTVEFQCMNLKVYVLRMLYNPGIFHDTTVKNALLYSYKKAIDDITIDGKKLDIKLNIVEPDNTRKYNHIILPNDLKLLDMADYIQCRDYGIYNGYCGTYVTSSLVEHKDDVKDEVFQDTLYVFPLYRNNDDKNDKELIIYGVSGILQDTAEITYLNSEDKLEIVSSDSSSMLDESSKKMLNFGAGFNAMKSDTVLKRNIDMSNGIKINREATTVDQSYKNRDDNLNVTANTNITDNMYNERSKVLKDKSINLQVKWNFSRPELLIPAMTVTYVYIDKDNTIKKVKGTLQNAFTSYNNNKKISASLLNITLTKFN